MTATFLVLGAGICLLAVVVFAGPVIGRWLDRRDDPMYVSRHCYDKEDRPDV